MRLGLTLLVLALAQGAAAQTLSGGSFELRRNILGPGAETTSPASSKGFTLKSLVWGQTASSYPLCDASCGRKLMPPIFYFGFYDHLITNRIQEGEINHEVTVHAEGVSEDFDFFLNTDPAGAPLRVDPALIEQATARLDQTAPSQAAIVPSATVELNVELEEAGFLDANLANPASVSLAYPDADNDGLVDGSHPPIRVATLSLYVLDEARGVWVKIPRSVVDRDSRMVTAPVPHFSVYALIGVADQDVKLVYAYPVPWAPNSGNPLDGTLAGGITFTNLPAEGMIRVFTLSGRLVRSLSIPAGLFPPQLKWNVKTDAGKDVASGVYLWRVESGKNAKTGKLMVIR